MKEYEKSKWDIDDIYNILINQQPVTQDAIRVWEGLANTFYAGTRRDITGVYSKKIQRVMELASEYGVEIPSRGIRNALEFINNQQNWTEDEQRDRNLPEQFTRRDADTGETPGES